MAHYTCIGANKDKIEKDLDFFKETGIQNLMLLRGDLPNDNYSLNQEFKYASDLVRIAKQKNHFCIGAAGYPESHLESKTKEEDIDHLKFKVDQGVDFLITQMFFDNNHYFDFVERCEKAGINVPIIPGIMPIVNFKQIKKFSEMCGATIPKQLADQLGENQDNPAAKYDIGVAFAIKQCNDLLKNGAPGLHFYTLNKSRATVDIFEAIDKE